MMREKGNKHEDDRKEMETRWNDTIDSNTNYERALSLLMCVMYIYVFLDKWIFSQIMNSHIGQQMLIAN